MERLFRPSPVPASGESVLGRRNSPRTRLNIPAKLVSVYATLDCVLADISASGALVRLDKPLAIDACGYLRVGSHDIFAITVRVAAIGGADALTGLKFEHRATREQIMEVRAYARELSLFDKRDIILAASDWVRGVGR